MSSAFIFLVVAIFVAIIFVLFSFAHLVYFGKKLSSGLSGRERVQILPIHKMWVDRFLLSLFFAVLLVEFMVQGQGGRTGNPTLFKIHLFLDVLMLAILACMRWYRNGNTHPDEHKRLSKIFFIVFTLVVITGSILFYQVLTSK